MLKEVQYDFDTTVAGIALLQKFLLNEKLMLDMKNSSEDPASRVNSIKGRMSKASRET